MRMEAKNAYTKKAASSGNFKNVVLSFAERHQRLLAYYLTDHNIMREDFESGPGTHIHIKVYNVPVHCIL